MPAPKFNLNYRIAHDLREVPEDRASMRAYVDFVALEAKRVKVGAPAPVRPAEEAPPPARAAVKLLGEVGSYARILGDLKLARASLERSLELIDEHQLGVLAWAVHTLRFAEVLRDEKDWLGAETACSSVLELSHRDATLRELEDFAWQALGKLRFAQSDFAGAESAFEEALRRRKTKNTPELVASTELALRIARDPRSRAKR